MVATIPPKKVNNSDVGDADHVGGDDWDKLADYLNNVDTTGPAIINTETFYRSAKLGIRNPADTFEYKIVSDAIAADRNITLPLLTANDILVTAAFAQTLTNKTMSGASNTFTNIPNTALSSDVVLENQSNTYGDFAQTFKDDKIKIENPAGTFTYTIAGAAIAASRILNLPLTTTTDTLACLGLAQTFTANQTVTGTLTVGPNNRLVLTDTNLTGARTVTVQDIATIGGESTHPLKIQSHDYFEVEDEFSCGSISNTNTSNSIGVLGWGTSASGTSAPVVAAGATSHPGIIQMITGGTSTNNMRLHLTDAAATAFIDPTDVERFAWIVRIPTITSITVRCGLMQDISAASGGTAGAYFQFDSATDADNWQTITSQASSSTTNTATTVTVDANDWFLLEAVRLSGGNWEFYLNNTLVFTHSATLPTTACNLGCLVQTGTTGARTLDVDYFKLRTKKLSQRWT